MLRTETNTGHYPTTAPVAEFDETPFSEPSVGVSNRVCSKS
jgi:hypothetical protein